MGRVLLSIMVVLNWSDCKQFLDSNFSTELSSVLEEIEFARNILIVIVSDINYVGGLLECCFKVSHVGELNFGKLCIIRGQCILEVQVSLNIVVVWEHIGYDNSFILARGLKSADYSLGYFIGS